METQGAGCEAFLKAREAISPFVRSRQEASHIRRVLTLDLKSHAEGNSGNTLTPPISLVNNTTALLPSAAKSHGLHKEYLRALKANVKAQQEYDSLSKHPNKSNDKQNEGVSLTPYLSLVKQRQKLERLRILQDYVENLSSKGSATASFLDEPAASTSGLPRLPPDVISAASHSAPSTSVNLPDLIQDLEKDVLRAKITLQSEKKLLKKVQADQKRTQRRMSVSHAPNSEQIMKALDKTRNALITWIEDELVKAGDTSDNASEPALEAVSDKMIEEAVDEVRAKYAEYLVARRRFISAAVKPVIPLAEATADESDDVSTAASPTANDEMVRLTTPYLAELLAVQEEQKSLTQQRSHLTTSLAKHNKETLQVFDRLAEESHLLAKYPSPTGAMASTFAAEMGMAVKENSGVSHKAKEWIQAAEWAGLDTMESVCISVDEGRAAIEEARKVLGSVEDMLGYDIQNGEVGDDEGDIWLQEVDRTDSNSGKAARKNIWSSIDGNLGALEDTR